MRLTKTMFLTALLGACLSAPVWAQRVWAQPVWSQPVAAQPVAITPHGPGNHFFISTRGSFPLPPPMIIPPLLMGMQAAHLTAHQQHQVDQVLQSNRSQTAPLLEQLQSVHEQIANKLLAPGALSEADLAPLEDRAARLDAEIQRQAMNASVQIRAILTPAQIARMARFHQKMAALQSQMRDLMNESMSPQPTPMPTR